MPQTETRSMRGFWSVFIGQAFSLLGSRLCFLAGGVLIIVMEIAVFFVSAVMNMEKLGETQ